MNFQRSQAEQENLEFYQKKLEDFQETEKKLMESFLPFKPDRFASVNSIPDIAFRKIRSFYDFSHRQNINFLNDNNPEASNSQNILYQAVVNYLISLATEGQEYLQNYCMKYSSAFGQKSNNQLKPSSKFDSIIIELITLKNLFYYNTGICPFSKNTLLSLNGSKNSYLNIYSYLFDSSLDDIIRDAIIYDFEETYFQDSNFSWDDLLNKLNDIINALLDLGLDNLIFHVQSLLVDTIEGKNLVLSSEVKEKILQEPSQSSSANKKYVHSIEETQESLLNLYHREFNIDNEILAYNKIITSSNETSPLHGLDSLFYTSNGKYLSLAAHNKLSALSHDYGLMLLYDKNGKIRLTGLAIITYLLKTSLDATEKYSTYYEHVKKYIKKSISNPIIFRFREFFKYHFGIPFFSQKEVSKINGIMNDYMNEYNEIYSFSIENDIAKAIVVYLQQLFMKTHLNSHKIPEVLRTSIIPDLQALNLSDAIPGVQNMLLQQFGNSLTAKERFAIQYPITSIKTNNDSANQFPYIYPPTVRHSAKDISL